MNTPAGVSTAPSLLGHLSSENGSIDWNRARPHLGIHHNAILRHEDWMQIDAAVEKVTRTGLIGINDLINAGLTKDLGDYGTYLSVYEQMSDMTEADVSMEVTVPGQKDRVTYTPQYTPVPLVFKEFEISDRMLKASRRNGTPLDVDQAETATRLVRDKLEDILFNGNAKQFGGYPVYGYTNHPKRTITTATGDFGTAGNGYKTFVKALGLQQAKGFDGPFMVYLAQAQYNELLNLLGTNDRNELEIIKMGLPQISDVKPCFNLTAGSFSMVQLTGNVVKLAIAEDITPIQWDERGGMLAQYLIFAAMVPEIRFDVNNACGILHCTAC